MCNHNANPHTGAAIFTEQESTNPQSKAYGRAVWLGLHGHKIESGLGIVCLFWVDSQPKHTFVIRKQYFGEKSGRTLIQPVASSVDVSCSWVP